VAVFSRSDSLTLMVPQSEGSVFNTQLQASEELGDKQRRPTTFCQEGESVLVTQLAERMGDSFSLKLTETWTTPKNCRSDVQTNSPASACVAHAAARYMLVHPCAYVGERIPMDGQGFAVMLCE
jgi:hypothetical protein